MNRSLLIKKLFFILICVSSYFGKSQVKFHNFGNIQMHQDSKLGFHIDLENDGIFNQNLGLVGFYNFANPLTVSGTHTPRFFDMEVEVEKHLYLLTNVEIINSVSYFLGDVITPRYNPDISLDYLSNSVYVLEDDFKNTDGYASFMGNTEFVFPIGDDDKLRPLITTNNSLNTLVKAAYFNEDPNFPSVFTQSFNTDNVTPLISKVSVLEFWDFDGPNNSMVTLTWDRESEIFNLVPDLLRLRVVGWHIVDKEWKDLGNSNITGTLNEGAINSFIFNPLEYEVLTFGALINNNNLTIINLLTPNNDNINDVFEIEGIESLNNKLKIYNRWGVCVYEAINYKNDWDGTADSRSVYRKNKKLPVGTYFYTIELTENKEYKAGWMYVMN